MNRLLFSLCVFVLTVSATAAADLSRDFDALAANQEQSAANVAAPINRKYRETLEKLLLTAQKEGDVDTQARIRHELEKLAAQPVGLAGLGAKSRYVGTWDVVVASDGSGYTMDLAADGTCLHDGERFGTWDATSAQLLITYDGHDNWQDRYVLPIRDGALSCKNAEGNTLTITRRGAPVPDAVKTALVGAWNFKKTGDADPAPATLEPGGSFVVQGRLAGSWTVSGNLLVISHGIRNEERDLYALPVKDGVIQGKNSAQSPVLLARSGAAGQ